MTDRKWFPVAPSLFVGETEPITLPPMPDNEALDASERAVHRIAMVDRSPVSINVALANMHADIIGEDRSEAHERRRMVPRQSVLRSIKERRDRMEQDRDRLLDALVFHELSWAHLADDCAICDRSVSHR